MVQLISRWGKEIDPGNILQEYPRPNLVRDSYFNLNGEWECRINESETADFYDETIIVPFSPESMLSGVGKIVMPHQRLHYRKKFTLPEGFRKAGFFFISAPLTRSAVYLSMESGWEVIRGIPSVSL